MSNQACFKYANRLQYSDKIRVKECQPIPCFWCDCSICANLAGTLLFKKCYFPHFNQLLNSIIVVLQYLLFLLWSLNPVNLPYSFSSFTLSLKRGDKASMWHFRPGHYLCYFSFGEAVLSSSLQHLPPPCFAPRCIGLHCQRSYFCSSLSCHIRPTSKQLCPANLSPSILAANVRQKKSRSLSSLYGQLAAFSSKALLTRKTEVSELLPYLSITWLKKGPWCIKNAHSGEQRKLLTTLPISGKLKWCMLSSPYSYIWHAHFNALCDYLDVGFAPAAARCFHARFIIDWQHACVTLLRLQRIAAISPLFFGSQLWNFRAANRD